MHENEGVPEPYVLFYVRSWLKEYEQGEESGFRAAFFGEDTSS